MPEAVSNTADTGDMIDASYDQYKLDNKDATAAELAAIQRPGGKYQSKGLEKLQREVEATEADAAKVAAMKGRIDKWVVDGYPAADISTLDYEMVMGFTHG